MIKTLMVTAILHHDNMVRQILDAKSQNVFFFPFYYCFNEIIHFFGFFKILMVVFGLTRKQTGTKALYVN